MLPPQSTVVFQLQYVCKHYTDILSLTSSDAPGSPSITAPDDWCSGCCARWAAGVSGEGCAGVDEKVQACNENMRKSGNVRP